MNKRCPDSPSAIDPNENVVRGIYSPNVYENGMITDIAVTMDELLSTKVGVVDICGDSSGVSVFRIDHEGGSAQADESLKQIVNKPMRNGTPRCAIGFATLKVSDVSNVPGGPLIMLDDGKKNLTCHAVIRAPAGKTKGAMREARKNLVSLMNSNLKLFSD